MGLTVNGPPPGVVYSYEPDVLGNRRLPQPTRVKLRTPTEAVKRIAGRKINLSMQVGDDGAPVRKDDGGLAFEVDGQEIEAVNLDLLEACVVEVENYTDGGGQQITTGRQLWENGDLEVVTDVIAEIQSGHALSAQKKSGLENSFASSKATSAPSSGTAKNVESSASISPEVAPSAVAPPGLS